MCAKTLLSLLVGGLFLPLSNADDLPRINKNDLRTAVRDLREIAAAFHHHHDVREYLPTDSYSKAGKPLLSWRVAILPDLGEEELYKQFKLDEPWDSDHNLKLVTKMPDVYQPVRVKARPGETFYQSFTGEKTLFVPKAKKGLSLATISSMNGISNTILLVEAAVPTVWTKPEDLPFDEKRALPKLGGLFDGDFHILMCDGSVRWVSRITKEAPLKLAINPSNDVPFSLPGDRK